MDVQICLFSQYLSLKKKFVFFVPFETVLKPNFNYKGRKFQPMIWPRPNTLSDQLSPKLPFLTVYIFGLRSKIKKHTQLKNK